MRSKSWPLALAAASLVALLSSSRPAHAQEEKQEGVAMSKNRGLHLGLGPVLLVPTDRDRPMGGGLDLHLRYGIKAGPTVISPGGMLGGYVQSFRLVGMAMPTARFTLPVGPIAPFVMGGVGGGWMNNPKESGLAVMGGGGLTVHFWRILALGMEMSYQTITSTEFKALAFGPVISIGG